MLDLLGELRGGKVTRGVIGVQIGDVPRDDYQVLGPRRAPRGDRLDGRTGRSRRNITATTEESSEGFGITLQDLTPQTMRRLGVPEDTVGAVAAYVAWGSTAEAGGLQSGDVILSVNRADVASAAEAGAALDAIEAGRTAFLLVQRRNTRVFLQLQVVSRV